MGLAVKIYGSGTKNVGIAKNSSKLSLSKLDIFKQFFGLHSAAPNLLQIILKVQQFYCHNDIILIVVNAVHLVLKYRHY